MPRAASINTLRDPFAYKALFQSLCFRLVFWPCVVARAALYGLEHFPSPFPRDTGPLDVPGQIRAKQDETPYHHYQKCQVLICVIHNVCNEARVPLRHFPTHAFMYCRLCRCVW